MKLDDVVVIGKLVLASVTIGAVIATAGPAMSKLFVQAVTRWLSR